jgi:type I restriction enzyme S subunit
MSEWPTLSLGEAGVSVLDCVHKTPAGATAGYPYIAIPDLADGRVSLSKVRRIVKSDWIEWTRRHRPRAGDVIVTRRGRVGDSAPIPNGMECAIGQNLVLLRSDESQVTQSFLRWLCRSPPWFSEVDRLINVGAVFSSLNVRDLPRFELPIPPISEQRRIAAVLDTLDELIETNRQIVAAALDLATASFSELVARSPGSARLSDVTTKIGSGATPRGGKDVYQESGVGFIRSQNVYDGEFAFEGLVRISDAAADSLRGVAVMSGDVLMNITGESVTRTALVPDRALPARVSQHVAIVRPDAQVLEPRFLILALLSAPIKAHLNGLSSAGATRRALTKAHLSETRIPLPPLAEQRRVAQILDTIEELGDEMANVIRVRDELLPLLTSGKVRVSENLAVA